MRPSKFEKISTSDTEDTKMLAELKCNDFELDESSSVALTIDDPEDNWPPISWEIFSDWQPFFDLGLPGALSLFFEWYVNCIR